MIFWKKSAESEDVVQNVPSKQNQEGAQPDVNESQGPDGKPDEDLVSKLWLKKYRLTEKAIRQLDPCAVVVIMSFNQGLVVLRSSDSMTQRIHQIEDRIGLVGIGADWAISTITDVLNQNIDRFIYHGFTRSDIRSNVWGDFLGRLLGSLFLPKGSKQELLSVFPAEFFIFEVGHPRFMNYVHHVRYDGKPQPMPGLSIIVATPQETTPDEQTFSREIAEIYRTKMNEFGQRGKVEILRAIMELVGTVAAAIRQRRPAPFFECALLLRQAVQAKDYKKVWVQIDTERAIAFAAILEAEKSGKSAGTKIPVEVENAAQDSDGDPSETSPPEDNQPNGNTETEDTPNST